MTVLPRFRMCRRVPCVVRVPSQFRNNFLMDTEIEDNEGGNPQQVD
jgi:hypothetical protein